jgi:hypothetical protein
MIKESISPKHLYYTIFVGLTLAVLFLVGLQLYFVNKHDIKGIIVIGVAWGVFVIQLIKFSYKFIFIDLTLDGLIRYGNISFL